MILLDGNSPDSLQVTTDAVGSVDVHTSFIDLSGTTITPGKQNTNIAVSSTVDVTSAPAASTIRNVKTVTIRNRSAVNINVTVSFNQNGTLFQMHKAGLSPGDLLEFIDGVGFQKIVAAGATRITKVVTTQQSLNSVDTYLTANVQFAAITIGIMLRWSIEISKTAAGIAAPTAILRLGTAGAIGDAAVITFTGVAQTGVVDEGRLEILATIRGPISASGKIQAQYRLDHNLAATGLSTQQTTMIGTLSGNVDLTVANMFAGLSVNPGASGVWTVSQDIVEAIVT